MATTDIALLLQQEQDFQFLAFDSTIALELGLLILKNAQQKGIPVVISITLNTHLLFHYSMPGTSPADVEWVRRKNNVVNQFYHSSLYVSEYLKQNKKLGAETYLVGDKDFVAYGGAFPLIVKGVGVVGTITVSGLSHVEDHELVVLSLKDFFGMEKEGKNKVE
ncbi:heme-degrading domain-containing protein [Gigaspora margarita]|uniref:Heme-degrading domain-containing protein n=1 Tax=Gigaspora margarita TaxID=4874 RepID=A0A8H4ETY9_GIGMA|nr:heme-degrading domain-containing protein [Gigaspora margarita]